MKQPFNIFCVILYLTFLYFTTESSLFSPWKICQLCYGMCKVFSLICTCCYNFLYHRKSSVSNNMIRCKMYGFVFISDEFVSNLKEYEIVVPSRVASDGRHVSYSLHPGHLLRRRSVDFNQPIEKDDFLHYSVEINNHKHVLKLNPNNKLVSPGFVIERRKNRFKNVTDSTFKTLSEDRANCHFHGTVLNQTNTKVALGICDGMVSLFWFVSRTVSIIPAPLIFNRTKRRKKNNKSFYMFIKNISPI